VTPYVSALSLYGEWRLRVSCTGLPRYTFCSRVRDFPILATQFQPRIVGIGGTLRAGSSSEKALRYTLVRASQQGAATELLTGDAIDLPTYVPESPVQNEKISRLVAALGGAHGIIVSSPGYHGSVSGMVKNALDYAEQLRDNKFPYFDGRAVGLIACAQGWQAAASTLSTLRNMVHALRGWPTPLGVAFNTTVPAFGDGDSPLDAALARQLDILAGQVLEYSLMRHRAGGESAAQ
jgi:FMN reductase